ncbi:MAG TPA: tripartite tricarboxylate transporter substrate-binding protein [Pseudomonas sp.]|nr:tripartite tricarboxylate transporter substrate-binding protein [Pseudomonas sp.]
MMLGRAVIIENKPGVSGNIAADQVAKATDDHTLGAVNNGNLTSAKMLYPKLSYDPAKDFSYISLLATAPLVLVALAKAPDGAATDWSENSSFHSVPWATLSCSISSVNARPWCLPSDISERTTVTDREVVHA